MSMMTSVGFHRPIVVKITKDMITAGASAAVSKHLGFAPSAAEAMVEDIIKAAFTKSNVEIKFIR